MTMRNFLDTMHQTNGRRLLPVAGALIAILLSGCQGATSDSTGTSTGSGKSKKASAAVASCMKKDGKWVNDTLAKRRGSDIYAGGRLYDNWMEELALADNDLPQGDQPLWETRDTNNGNSTAESLDTWRCKECHGWDYKGKDGVYASGDHFTGFDGILDARDMKPEQLFCTIKAEKDHDFGEYFADDQAILDLTAFILDDLNGMQDFDLIVNADLSVNGDALSGQALYTDNCALCHNDDGKGEGEWLGDISMENPAEFGHKVMFGDPGAPEMPVFGEGSRSVPAFLLDTEIADLLAYAQANLPKTPKSDGGGTPANAADIVQGALLFDDWPTVLARNLTSANPLYDLRDKTNTATAATAAADTWRCAECHGWDYRGKDGQFRSGHPQYTGFGGLLNAQYRTQTALTNVISKGFVNPVNGQTVHSYGSYFSAAQINQLVAFIQGGIVDTEIYVSTLGTNPVALGDSVNGKILYNSSASTASNPACSSCHGADGKTIALDEGSLGAMMRAEPWESLHKIRFGQPGEPGMTERCMLSLGRTTEEAVDIVTFGMINNASSGLAD